MPEKENNSPSPIKVSVHSMFDFSITNKERKEIIDKLIEESRADNAFYILLILSTVITVSGLLMDNLIVVLGGMLVAPLLTPILSFGMSMVTSQRISIFRSANIIAKSTILVLITSILTTLLINFPKSTIMESNEFTTRTEMPMMLLFVSLFAGLAAAFAWAKPKLSASLPGVAVAASLLPPLVVSGVSVAILEKDIFFSSFQLYLVNLIITIFASSMVFSLFGFFSARKEEEKKVVEEIKEIKEEKKEIAKEIKSKNI